MRNNICIFIFLAISLLLGVGCSHNPAVFAFGKVARIGNVEYGELSYVNGIYILDVSRENSEWEIEIDDQDGLQYDAKSGVVKGVKKIKRKIGRQITGYLVDLAKKDKYLAGEYIKEPSRQSQAKKPDGSLE